MALPEIHFVKCQATVTPYYSHKKFIVMYYMFYNFSALPSANVKRDLNVVVLAQLRPLICLTAVFITFYICIILTV
jgi:hypothetical protein